MSADNTARALPLMTRLSRKTSINNQRMRNQTPPRPLPTMIPRERRQKPPTINIRTTSIIFSLKDIRRSRQMKSSPSSRSIRNVSIKLLLLPPLLITTMTMMNSRKVNKLLKNSMRMTSHILKVRDIQEKMLKKNLLNFRSMAYASEAKRVIISGIPLRKVLIKAAAISRILSAANNPFLKQRQTYLPRSGLRFTDMMFLIFLRAKIMSAAFLAES